MAVVGEKQSIGEDGAVAANAFDDFEHFGPPSAISSAFTNRRSCSERSTAS